MSTPQQELETLLQYMTLVDGSLLLFCTYTSLDDIRGAAQACDPPPEWIDVRPDGWAFFAALKPQDPRPAFVVLRYELASDLRAFGEYVDLHREELLHVARAVVMWIPNSMVRDFIQFAPNFWSWNTGGLFELAGLSGSEEISDRGRQQRLGSGALEVLLTPTAREAILQRLEIEQATLEAQRARLENQPYRMAEVLLRIANLAGMLGRRQDAYKHTLEATNLYRLLVDSSSEAFKPNLARGLNNLSFNLGQLGDREAALKISQEAVDIYRTLVIRDPQAFNSDLAHSLVNLNVSFGNLGSNKAALQAIQEAVSIYRILASENPRAFNPDLAHSLTNLSADLSELGDNHAALQAIQEAVSIRRDLASRDPQFFNLDLARSLSNLSVDLISLEQEVSAHQAIQEAVNIYRALAAENPQAFSPDLAFGLNNLGAILNVLGDRKSAHQAVQEAVNIYRALAAENPQAFSPDLARSLYNMAEQYADDNKWDVALPLYNEAARILNPFATRYAQAFGQQFKFYREDYLEACKQTGTTPDPELVESLPS